MRLGIIVAIIATALFLIWNLYLYIKYRKVPKRYKFFLLNIFDNGIPGFGVAIAYALFTVLYFITLSICL